MDKGITRFTSLVLLFGIVSTIGMVSLPNAMAMNSPFNGVVPANPAFGDPVVLTMIGDPFLGTAPHEIDRVRVFVPAHATTVEGALGADCQDLGADGVNRVWELHTTAVSGVPVTFHLEASDMIEIPYGNGDGLPVAITLTDEAPLGPPFTTSSSATGVWVEVSTASGAFDNTEIPGEWEFGACGTEASGDFDLSVSFTVQATTGGEYLSIDNTALLIAGMQSSAMWLLPLIVTAGAAFTLLKFQIDRKGN